MTSVPYNTAPQAFDAEQARTMSAVLTLFFVVTLIPLSFSLAGLRLTPLRLVLLVAFVPFTLKIMRGAVGRFTWVDGMILAHAAWIVLALVVVHGTERIPLAGITMVELVGGYVMGRVLIQSAEDYRRMIVLLMWSMIVLLPFVVIELLTGRMIIPDLIKLAFESHSRMESAYGRLGLERVFAVFEHPILFGLYCSIAFANLYYLTQCRFFPKTAGLGLIGFMTFCSLSSGPLLAAGLQGVMMVWDKVTKGSWKTFAALVIGGYVIVDLMSNRTPIIILIETLTFNAGTGWIRINIFNYGLENALEHPIFGIGLNDWERPSWLTGSIDNFWLLTTMRFGFVGAFFVVAAFVLHFVFVVRTRSEDITFQALKKGYMIAFVALCFTLVTVHVWGAVGVFVMFYLGAGGWFYTTDPVETPTNAAAQITRSRQGGFSRFTAHEGLSTFARSQGAAAPARAKTAFSRGETTAPFARQHRSDEGRRI